MYSTMTVQELEKYGSNIQENIKMEMNELVNKARCVDLGATSGYLQELSDVTNDVTKKHKLTSLIPFGGVKKWLARYETVESRLNELGSAVETEKLKLNNILNALLESKDSLSQRSVELTNCENELRGYLEWVEANPDEDADGLKKQACVNRLKVIVTTNAVVQQELVKSVLVIKENKEIVQQLTEASENLLPMFSVMMLNTLASKANAEAVKMRKAMITTANKMIVENAKQIQNNANDLIAGRSDSLVSVQSIEEANRILQATIKKVVDSSALEEKQNIMLVDSIKGAMVQLDDIKMIG